MTPTREFAPLSGGPGVPSPSGDEEGSSDATALDMLSEAFMPLTFSVLRWDPNRLHRTSPWRPIERIVDFVWHRLMALPTSASTVRP